MNRSDEIKAEIAVLLGLEDLDGIEIAFNTRGRNHTERYITVKGPHGKEELWEPHKVETIKNLFNEYYQLNRDDTEEVALEEALWNS